MPPRRRLQGALAALLLGCASSTQRAPPSAAPSARSAAPSWRTQLLPLAPHPEDLRRATLEGRERGLWLVGSQRVERTPQGLRLAPRFAASALLAAAEPQETHRWLWLTADGLLLSSEGPLEDLERVGAEAGVSLREGFSGVDAVAAVDSQRRLWLGDAQRGLHRPSLPLDAPVVQALPTSRSNLAVLLDLGFVLHSHDGAESLQRLDLGDAVLSLRLDAGHPQQVLLQGLRAWYSVDAQGVVSPLAQAPAEAPSADTAAQELLEELASMPPGAAPSPLLVHPHGGAARSEVALLTDGRALTSDTQGELQLRGPEGSARLRLPSPQCDFGVWGRRVLFWCRGEDPDSEGAEFFAWSGEGRPESLGVHPSDGGVELSRDGRSLLLLNACASSPASARGAPEEPSEEEASEPGCFFYEGLWRSVRLLRRSSRDLLFGPRWISVGEEEHDLVLREQDLRAEQPSTRPLHLLGVLPRAGERGWERLEGTADGRALEGVLRVGERRFGAVGTPEEGLRVRPLPPAARAAAFADLQRGVAFGDTLAELWSTEDAGLRWTPLPVRLDGGADSVALTLQGSERGAPLFSAARSLPEVPALECSSAGCLLGERLLWGAPSFLTAEPAAPALSAREDVRPVFGEERAREPAGTPRWVLRCARPEPPRASRSPAPRTLLAPTGAVELLGAGPDSPTGRGSWRARWWGFDSEGTYRVSPPEAVNPADLALLGDSQELVALAVSRSAVLFSRCARRWDPADCEVLLVSAQGRFQRVGTPRSLSGVLTSGVASHTRVLNVVARQRGYGLLVGGLLEARSAYAIVLTELDELGQVRSWRGTVWSPERVRSGVPVSLTWDPRGRLALFTRLRARSEPSLLLFADGTTEERSVPSNDGILPSCDGRRESFSFLSRRGRRTELRFEGAPAVPEYDAAGLSIRGSVSPEGEGCAQRYELTANSPAPGSAAVFEQTRGPFELRRTADGFTLRALRRDLTWVEARCEEVAP